MLNHEIRYKDEILMLSPEGRLKAEDFTNLARVVDSYLEQRGTLRGILIHAASFPGWEDFGALLAHLKFVSGHHKKIEKVAVVADGAVANIMPFIANHFVHAKVRHFDFALEDEAMDWLTQSDAAASRRRPESPGSGAPL